MSFPGSSEVFELLTLRKGLLLDHACVVWIYARVSPLITCELADIFMKLCMIIMPLEAICPHSFQFFAFTVTTITVLKTFEVCTSLVPLDEGS
jgi:hypothetical protein